MLAIYCVSFLYLKSEFPTKLFHRLHNLDLLNLARKQFFENLVVFENNW